MKRNSFILSVSVLLVLVVSVAGCVNENTEPPSFDDPVTQQNMEIARIFVLNSVTYEFDGYGLEGAGFTHQASPERWTFIFAFNSTHAGYGDRTDQMLAQVITLHTALITVENGEVTSGILDSEWDMMKQELLPNDDLF